MKLHVLINSLNNGASLAECIGSVINQTYQDIEIEIFDRGSTDMTRNIIEKFMQADKRIKLSTNGAASPIGFLIDAKNKLTHLNFFEIAMNNFKKYPKLGICTGIIQSFNEKNEYLGSLGKINGNGDRSPFNFTENKDMSLLSRDKIDIQNTLLPVSSSIIRSSMGDVLFIHQTVLRFNDDPKKLDMIQLREVLPVAEALPNFQKTLPKKTRGRPKGSKNKEKAEPIPTAII